MPQSPAEDLGTRTVRRISLRLMPFLFVLYVIAYLDRVNVSFASLQMTHELGLSAEQYGFAAGVFFLGYFLLEVPCAVLVETWSARRLIARIMVTWGLLAAATGFVQNATQLNLIRFALGMAEAGFFPGMLIYLSNWFRAADRAKAIAMFMAAIPLSEALGAPVSAALMKLDWLGMAGWRWLLILEGLPAVLLGFVTLFYLTDRPHQAKWLKPEERDWITSELAKDAASHPRSGHSLRAMWSGMSDPRTMLLMLTYFSALCASYGILMWLPKILKSLPGMSVTMATLLTAVPFAVAVPAGILAGFHSDKTGERRWHAVLASATVGAALAAMPTLASAAPMLIALFAVAVSANSAQRGPFWAIATTNQSGTARAAAVGLINSFGNLGGFVGPFVVGWITKRTGGYEGGLYYLAVMAGIAACAVLAASMAGIRQQPRSEPLPAPGVRT